MTMRKVKNVLLLSCVLLLAALSLAQANVYKYRDGQGVICITDKLESVPLEYRASMLTADASHPEKEVARSGVESNPPAPLEPSVRTPGEESEAQSRAGRLAQVAAAHPWLKPLVILCGVLAGFFLLSKLCEALPSRQLGRVICFAFAMGVVIFGYKTYAEQMTANYLNVKNRILSMFKKGNEQQVQPEKKDVDLVSDPSPGR